MQLAMPFSRAHFSFLDLFVRPIRSARQIGCKRIDSDPQAQGNMLRRRPDGVGIEWCWSHRWKDKLEPPGCEVIANEPRWQPSYSRALDGSVDIAS